MVGRRWQGFGFGLFLFAVLAASTASGQASASDSLGASRQSPAAYEPSDLNPNGSPLSGLDATAMVGPTTIVSVGDSNTKGMCAYNSPAGFRTPGAQVRSYRLPLQALMTTDGFSVGPAGDYNFVGRRNGPLTGCGNMPNTGAPNYVDQIGSGTLFSPDNHEGYPGLSASEIAAKIAETSFPTADLALVIAGTNDVFAMRNCEDGYSPCTPWPAATGPLTTALLDQFEARLSTIVDNLRLKNSNMEIYLATLFPCSPGDGGYCDLAIPDINARIQSVASDPTNEPITLVDLTSGFSSADLWDGVHLTQSGEQWVAGRFWNEIRGSVPPPVITDVLWHHQGNGEVYGYDLSASTIVSQGTINNVADLGWQIEAVGDFNGDARPDVLWRHGTTGQVYAYLMNGFAIASQGTINYVADTSWRIEGVGDFNGDTKDDILWRHQVTGHNYVYLMDGVTITSAGTVNTEPNLQWKIEGLGDFNGDTKADILWRNEATGETYLYLMNGVAIASQSTINTVSDRSWKIAGVGDFDADTKVDILWRNDMTGQNYLYLMNAAVITSSGTVNTIADQNWKIESVTDTNMDGTADILWRHHVTGENYLYLMNGFAITSSGLINTVADLDWAIVS